MTTDVQRGMVRKTINRNINRKIDAWLRSLKYSDDHLKLFYEAYPTIIQSKDQKETANIINSHIKSSVVVTGGAIASMLLGEMPNDYDVYFSDKKIAKFVAQYYVTNANITKNDKVSKADVTETNSGVKIFVRSAGVVSGSGEEVSGYEYFEGDSDGNSTESYVERTLKSVESAKENSFSALYMSSNAITLSDGIQIVLRFTGTPTQIHSNFDFVHATNYWTDKEGAVLLSDAMESLLQRRLAYFGSKYPICSLFRIRKFLKRGFTISASEIFKIAWDISKLDLNDFSVLEDQLIGVDQAYFNEIVSVLKKEYGEGKQLDRTYLFSLVDRIFDEDL